MALFINALFVVISLRELNILLPFSSLSEACGRPSSQRTLTEIQAI
jgi:hypothetical protein